MSDGNHNSGDHNSGDHNSGYYNSGNYNSGSCNSGYYNSGNHNSGYYNSGYYNSGSCNSGYYNSGSYNSGSYNSGDYNSGYLNTTESCVRILDHQTNIPWSDFPHDKLTLKPQLTEWINSDNMTEQEKKDNPNYKITKGFLKTVPFKEACQKAWNNMPDVNQNTFVKLILDVGVDIEHASSITGIDLKLFTAAMCLLNKNDD